MSNSLVQRFTQRLTPVTKDILTVARRHPILTSVLVVLAIAFELLGILIGFAPIGVLLIPVAFMALYLVRRRARNSTNYGRAEAIASIFYFTLSVVLVFALIQFIPYGRAHSNPVVSGEPNWDSPRTRELAVNACYSCHSNEVEYPAYANVAPISWMVQNHVSEGRSKLNFSTFDVSTHGANDAIKVILNGSMPPSYYTRFGRHPEARLSDSEIKELVSGLKLTFAQSGVKTESKQHGDKYDED
ncbi:MAG: heme-binding domain-containing protein [Ilumatobacteraceae bacterium]